MKSFLTSLSAYTFLLLIASVAGAQSTPTDAERLAQFQAAVDRPVVLTVPGMDRVNVRRDIIYKTDGSTSLALDVYTPPDLPAGSTRPAVIFIHGGLPAALAFMKPKDWGIYKSYGRLIAASGLAGVTFNYRMGYPDPDLKQAARDVTDLINYVREHGAELGIDKDRICLAAYSAGGPMLSLGMGDSMPYVKSLVAMYAILDVRYSPLYRKCCDADELRRFSPAAYLESRAGKLPPIFVGRAGQDQAPGLLEGMNGFVARAIVTNAPIEFLNDPAASHAFDNQPADPGAKAVVRAELAFMKEFLTE